MIEQHGMAVVYDLRAIGVDVRHTLRGDPDLSPRYVLGLVGQMPPDTALAAARRGGYQYRMWTPEIHLLAAAVNLLNAANRQRAGKRTREPLVAPPKQERQVRRVSVAEIAAKQRARATSN